MTNVVADFFHTALQETSFKKMKMGSSSLQNIPFPAFESMATFVQKK